MKTVTFDETQWKLVPIEPTEEMWGGLARDIMMAWDFNQKTPYELFDFLTRSGHEIPGWLYGEKEMNNRDHMPSKGTRATLIYRAFLEDAPTLPVGVTNTQNPEDALTLFDNAVAQELPRVSTIKCNSHEICEHFAQHVRNAIAAHVAPANAQEQEDAESILLGQILSDWHNRGETGDVDGAWLQDIVVDSGLATLNDEGYVLTQRAMELIGMGDAARAAKEQP